MIGNRVYRGTVVRHSLWKVDNSFVPVTTIEMSPGLAGAYTFKAKARYGTKTYVHHGRFNKAVISDNRISFFITQAVLIKGKSKNHANEPCLVIDFEEGEISRLLSEDRWFKDGRWFKVVVENLQPTIF